MSWEEFKSELEKLPLWRVGEVMQRAANEQPVYRRIEQYWCQRTIEGRK